MNIVKTKNGAGKCEDNVEWSKNGQNHFYDNDQNSKIKSISFVFDLMKKINEQNLHARQNAKQID